MPAANRVLIGDSPGDMLCGRAYGAPTVWCAWGYYPEPPGHADRIAGHPIELAPAVLALQRLVD